MTLDGTRDGDRVITMRIQKTETTTAKTRRARDRRQTDGRSDGVEAIGDDALPAILGADGVVVAIFRAMSRRNIGTVDAARAILEELGAPDRLIRHGLLVLEAADLLLAMVADLEVSIDEGLVRMGTMLHDAGKILHPNELLERGSSHEEAGERLLLGHGVDPVVARCCVTHAQWTTHECSLEELLVALADALWKGVRRPKLEERVVGEVASRLGTEPWAIFVEMDTCFERIADGGSERLSRSV